MAKRTATSNLTRDNWDCEEDSEEMGVFRKASPNELKMRTMKKGKRFGSAGESLGPSIFQNFTAFRSTVSTSTPSFSFIDSNSTLKTSSANATPFASSIFNNGSSKTTLETKDNTKETTLPSPPMFSFVQSSNEAKPKKTTGTLSLSPESNKKEENSNTVVPSFSFGTNSELFNKSKNSELNKNANLNTTSTSVSGLFSFMSKENIKHNETKLTPKISSEQIESQSSKNSVKTENSFLNSLKSLNMNLLDWLKQHLDKNQFIDLTPIFEDYKNHLGKIKKEKSECQKAESIVSSKSDSTCTTTGMGTELKKVVPSFTFGLLPSSKDNKNESPMNSITNFKSNNGTADTNANCSNKEFSFGNTIEKSAPFQFTAGNKSSNGPLFGSNQNEKKASFSFGVQSETSSFNFGTPVTNFGSKSSEAPTIDNDDNKSDEPPKVEVKEIKEENSIYEQKVKLFYKKENNYVDKGVGNLFLKPAGDKIQLIVRALTNLGTILLNIVLNKSIPTQRVGKNNVLIVCVPNPPIDNEKPNVPVSMLIRVKNSEDADKLLEKIDELKNKEN